MSGYNTPSHEPRERGRWSRLHLRVPSGSSRAGRAPLRRGSGSNLRRIPAARRNRSAARVRALPRALARAAAAPCVRTAEGRQDKDKGQRRVILLRHIGFRASSSAADVAPRLIRQRIVAPVARFGSSFVAVLRRGRSAASASMATRSRSHAEKRRNKDAGWTPPLRGVLIGSLEDPWKRNA